MNNYTAPDFLNSALISLLTFGSIGNKNESGIDMRSLARLQHHRSSKNISHGSQNTPIV